MSFESRAAKDAKGWARLSHGRDDSVREMDGKEVVNLVGAREAVVGEVVEEIRVDAYEVVITFESGRLLRVKPATFFSSRKHGLEASTHRGVASE